MTILRSACYLKFSNIIGEASHIYTLRANVYSHPDAIYEDGTSVKKLDLSKFELEEFILKTTIKTLGQSKSTHLNKTTDLFAFGVDSLQAIKIRNICQKNLELNGKILGQNGKQLHL